MADNNQPISLAVPDTLPNILVDGGAWLDISKGALDSFAHKYSPPKVDVGLSSENVWAEKNDITKAAGPKSDSHTFVNAVKPGLSFLDLPYDIRHTVS